MAIAIMFIFHLRPFGFNMLDISYFFTIIGLLLPLGFLWIPATKGAPRDKLPWYEILLFLLALIIPLYIALHGKETVTQGWSYRAPLFPLVLACILWPLLVEAARRSGGLPFATVVLLASSYPFIAGLAPGVFRAVNFPLTRVASFHIYGIDSLLGVPMHTFGVLFIGYMVFAMALQSCGAGKFFNQFAISAIGSVRGGNAKVAILASGLFGSISGSAIANVYTTGTFTIPAMIKDGFPPEFAGGVEACASSGGTLMPPIMGAVAFIMAEFLGIPYATVVIVATVPAVLYYFSMFMQIDAYAARHHLSKPVSTLADAQPMRKVLLGNLHIILGFLVLLYMLFFLQLENWAPWISTAILFALTMVRKETRLNWRGILNFFESTGRVLGELIGILGPVGMIVGALVLTGLAYSLPYILVDLAGGNIALLLIGGALSSFIMGMGLVTSACYLFLAIILAPGLVMAGLNVLAVHLFILYCAIMSHITPPVATCAFAASSISGADPVKTGLRAMRLGIVLFIVPFFFVLNPALILQGPLLEILQSVSTALLGLTAIAAGIEGYVWRLGVVNAPVRILLMIGGVMVALPEANSDILGLGLVAAVLLVVFLSKKGMFRGLAGAKSG
ncbi:MAG: TRAP transporter fused permease subunit [Chloroflexota bacterium]